MVVVAASRVVGPEPVTVFAGVAEDYQRYRVSYPEEVFDWSVREHNLDGRGRLLDAGCGTGYVCLPLSRWFEDVLAIDPEPDMLRVAALAARRQGVANVRFLRLRAEDVPTPVAPLRLVTFGNSFHWTDRVTVARALFPLIAPGVVSLPSPAPARGRASNRGSALCSTRSPIGSARSGPNASAPAGCRARHTIETCSGRRRLASCAWLTS